MANCLNSRRWWSLVEWSHRRRKGTEAKVRFVLFFLIDRGKTAIAPKEIEQILPPQIDATAFAFASIPILLLWVEWCGQYSAKANKHFFTAPKVSKPRTQGQVWWRTLHMKYKSFTDASSKHRISSLDLYNLSFHHFSCLWVLYSHLKITNYISISFIYFRVTKLDLPRTSSSISSSVGFCPILRITPTSSCRNCRLFSTQMSPFPLIKSHLWY